MRLFLQARRKCSSPRTLKGGIYGRAGPEGYPNRWAPCTRLIIAYRRVLPLRSSTRRSRMHAAGASEPLFALGTAGTDQSLATRGPRSAHRE